MSHGLGGGEARFPSCEESLLLIEGKDGVMRAALQGASKQIRAGPAVHASIPWPHRRMGSVERATLMAPKQVCESLLLCLGRKQQSDLLGDRMEDVTILEGLGTASIEALKDPRLVPSEAPQAEIDLAPQEQSDEATIVTWPEEGLLRLDSFVPNAWASLSFFGWNVGKPYRPEDWAEKLVQHCFKADGGQEAPLPDRQHPVRNWCRHLCATEYPARPRHNRATGVDLACVVSLISGAHLLLGHSLAELEILVLVSRGGAAAPFRAEAHFLGNNKRYTWALATLAMGDVVSLAFARNTPPIGAGAPPVALAHRLRGL